MVKILITVWNKADLDSRIKTKNSNLALQGNSIMLNSGRYNEIFMRVNYN